MLQVLKRRLSNGAFLTTPLSIITNPVYIMRSGLLKAVKELAPSIKGEVMDLGCGCKPYASLFTAATRYVGVDIEASGHDHKTSKVDVFYDGRTLPFLDAHFDAVVTFEVLEHVFNLDEVLAEILRVLKPGGLLLVSIPFAWDEHEKPYDFARYTSFGIRHVLQKAGLEVVELRKCGTYFLAICQMFIAYLIQHVFPQGRLPRRVMQVLLVFPLTALSLVLDRILPRRDEYFCNTVVLSRKIHSVRDSAGR